MSKIEANVPRVMLVGTNSGCGKTTITCSVLRSLVNKKINVGSFKCGPDYIDPMFHTEVVGAKSRNLDLFMNSEATVKYLLGENGQKNEISIIEGVMGMYDGSPLASSNFSSTNLALVTDTPQILVINVRGMALSLCALISGFINYEANNVAGVILNNCNAMMYKAYKEMLEEKLNIKVYGFMPQVEEATIGSRHLGLVTAEEISDLQEKLDVLARVATESIDIDGIIELAKTAPAIEYENIEVRHLVDVKIAAARDKAFSFYYQDNLDLLEKLGAEIINFSPLNDKSLPEGISGIYIGGGYPEEHLATLSANTSMLEAINEAISQGVPTFAECGGFMYLQNSITTLTGETHNMVGAIDTDCFMTKKLTRFGYIKLKAQEESILFKEGDEIPAHEFHYSDSNFNGESLVATKAKREYKCYYNRENLFAGYPHLHFWGNIDTAKNFVLACKNYMEGK